MYESPITLYQRQIVDGVMLHIENETIKAILAYDIKVDKDELLRALSYDRGQYEKGHSDGFRIGYESRDNEIVRCKDCKHYEPCEGGKDYCCWHESGVVESDFCSYGERR